MNEASKPRILITNDDSFTSEMLISLAKALSEYAHVTVIAPATEMSGVSQSFTYANELHLQRINSEDAFDFYSLSGTPSDCIKFGIAELCRTTPVDVVFSGINNGENAGVAAVYSGTIAGTREAALWSIPAIALSLTAKNDFILSEALRVACFIVQSKLYRHIKPGTFWNLNFPNATAETYGGIRVTSMGLDMFSDHYLDKGNENWLLEGCKPWENAGEKTDDAALYKNYAALTPLTVDQTAYGELERVRNFFTEVSAKNEDTKCQIKN